MVSPQPSDELLDKMEQIASMKRELPRMERAQTSRGGLYVWADELPDGRTLVRAGSRSIFAKLIFYVHPDGRKEVKKYQPGDWEAGVDDTLRITEMLWRAAHWSVPPAKLDEYSAYEDWHDWGKFLEVADAYNKVLDDHHAEISALGRKDVQATNKRLGETFFDTLRDEWPVEYLEVSLLAPKGEPVSFDRALEIAGNSYCAGYVAANGWLSPEHLDILLIGGGCNLADPIRKRWQAARCHRYPFIQALRNVAALGMAAAAEERPEVSANPDNQAAPRASRAATVDRSTVLELLKAERWREAVEVYEAGVDAFGQDMDLVEHMGWAYLHSRRYEETLRCWRVGLEVHPGDPDPHYVLVELLLALDRIVEAEMAARDAVSCFPHDAQLRAQLAQILEARNKFREAGERFEDVALHWVDPSCLSEPMHPDLRRAMEDGYARDAIRCYLKAGDRSSALAIAGARLRSVPNSEEGWDWLLQIHWADTYNDMYKAQDVSALAGKFEGMHGASDCLGEAKEWLREIEEAEESVGTPAKVDDDAASQDTAKKGEARDRPERLDQRWRARLREKKRRPSP